MLRAQQLLKQRCAWFEKPQGLRPTFQLPPLQQPAAVRGNEQQDNVTYTFSVSRGIALKVSVQIHMHPAEGEEVRQALKGPNKIRQWGWREGGWRGALISSCSR